MPIPKQKIKMFEERQSVAGDWVRCELALASLKGEWRDDNPLRLRDIKTIRYRETGTRLYFMAKLDVRRSCDCGAPDSALKKNGLTGVIKIKDLPIHNKPCVIFYRAQRYICSACGNKFQAISDEIDDRRRMTRRLRKFIEDESLSTFSTFRDVANVTGASEHVVRNIFTEHVVELQKARVIQIPEWIAIDEVKTSSKRPTWCVVSSPLDNRVLELLCDNADAVKLFFANLPGREKIEVISIDMWQGYRTYAHKYMPHAQIVVDRYHAQKLINEAFKDVLAVIRMILTRAQHKDFMCRESFLMEGKFVSKKMPARKKKMLSKISPEEKKRALDHLFSKLPDVAAAHALKEDLAAILNLWDYEEARRRLADWLERVKEFVDYFYKKYEAKCKRLGKRPFGNIHVTVTKWFEEILNYVKFKNKFDKKISNAFAENLNRKIRRLNDLGYGYNFDVLRAKLVFGNIRKNHLPPDPLSRRRRGTSSRCRTAGSRPDSNVRKLINAYEDGAGIPARDFSPSLEEAVTSRLPLEVIRKGSEAENPLERRTRFARTNLQIEPGAMRKVRGENIAGNEDLIDHQAELFSPDDGQMNVPVSAGADAERAEEDKKKTNRRKQDKKQPSLF